MSGARIGDLAIPRVCPSEEFTMKKVVISLAVGVGALFATAASAAPSQMVSRLDFLMDVA